MTHIKRTSKLPAMKIKNYGIPRMIYIETNIRNGNNDIILRMEKGPVTARSKHSYFIRMGDYKFDKLKVIGIDLVE